MTRRPAVLATLPAVVAMALCAGPAAAAPLALARDGAQLKMDLSMLRWERKRYRADEARLKTDAAAGRMAAESKDAFAIYQDERAMRGERHDIAGEKAGLPQWREDEATLHRERGQLANARRQYAADAKAGRLAAVSPDAERVYQDRLAIGAEARQVRADEALVRKDKAAK